jgi:Rrf2 family protein
MKLSQGVEWMLHGVGLIAQAPDGVWVSRRVLAEHYRLPEAYLAKHLKSLVRAGVLVATPGPSGGFRLARPAAEITALDVVEAVEGSASPFACQEIRTRVPGAPESYRRPCAISSMMDRAHQAWRSELRQVTVLDIVQMAPRPIRERTAARLAALSK